ncbi:MAG TPA: acyloxyacyl hydrolase [Caulobacteraceae bacterium]
MTAPPPGPLGDYDRSHRLLLGSKVLFRAAAGVDWRIDSRWSIGAEFVHLSNGHIFDHEHNEGINDAGIRLGFRFR